MPNFYFKVSAPTFKIILKVLNICSLSQISELALRYSSKDISIRTVNTFAYTILYSNIMYMPLFLFVYCKLFTLIFVKESYDQIHSNDGNQNLNEKIAFTKLTTTLLLVFNLYCQTFHYISTSNCIHTFSILNCSRKSLEITLQLIILIITKII